MHRGGHCPQQSLTRDGWLLDTIFIPDTQSLQQSSLQGSVPAVLPRLIMGEAFCLCPSGPALLFFYVPFHLGSRIQHSSVRESLSEWGLCSSCAGLHKDNEFRHCKNHPFSIILEVWEKTKQHLLEPWRLIPASSITCSVQRRMSTWRCGCRSMIELWLGSVFCTGGRFGVWSMTLIQGIYIPFLSQEPGWGRR